MTGETVHGPRVPGVGPADAKIALIGEAPGAQEEKALTPFVGGAGRLLNGVLSAVGIRWSECYIDNVFPYRPPRNNLKHITQLGFSNPYVFLPQLREKLERMRPNVIVALGDTALYALTGLKGVTKWRGSILEGPGGIKTIPTYHPAAVLRMYEWLPVLKKDFARIKVESETPVISLPQRFLNPTPTFERVREALCCIVQEHLPVVVDIETLRGHIACIGFAWSAVNAICVPFDTGFGSYWPTAFEEAEVWKLVYEVLQDDTVPKCCHNAAFEMRVLGGPGVLRGLVWDTMIVGHCLYPELPKSLAFYTSVYTREPFYKEEGRTWVPGKDSAKQLYLYNCKDCAVTYEIWERQQQEVDETGLRDFIETYQIPLIRVLHDMGTRGVLADEGKIGALTAELKARAEQLQEELNQLAGRPINVNSPQQLRKLFYETLKARPHISRHTGRPTLDEEALVRIAKRYRFPLAEKVIELRKVQKILSTYLDIRLFKGRIVTSYNQAGSTSSGVVTGRISSSKDVYGYGANLQNIPTKHVTKPHQEAKVGAALRGIFIADPGYVLVEADYSQAEARAVAWLANEEILIRYFEEGRKIHALVASRIFGVPEEKVQKGDTFYEIAKRCVHSGNYGVGARTFAEITGLTLAEAERTLGRYYQEFPNIRKWQQSVEEAVRKTRKLVTPIGRHRQFLGRFDSRLVRRAIAHVPQSMVADMLNLALLRIYWRIKETDFILLMQVHDSIVAEAPEGREMELVDIIREEMEQPVVVDGRALVIPAEFAVGKSWGSLRPV
jgi:DNA polymerase-1